MLKGYRKRFIIYNMALVGAVLLIALTALGVVTARRDERELKNTMSLMTGPWDRPGSAFRPLDERPPMGERPAGEREDVVSVFYSESTGEISVMPEGSLDPDEIRAAVSEIAGLRESFGRLRGLIYYKEPARDGLKIALAGADYLTSRTLRHAAVLAAVFVLSMGLFYLISLKLSKLAAKPMEDAVEMERQFVADISHDLKTPITVILANSGILRSDPGARISEQSQWLESTETAAKNMMGMVERMLDLSALEQTAPPVKSRVCLSEAAEKSALQLESFAYERGVGIVCDIEPGIFISAPADHAERICGGLLENAVKYEPPGGTAEITLKRQKKKAVLTVRDPGGVIEPRDLPHIFERFYRGDRSRGQTAGHGLGLPIVKRLCELSGAAIEAQSRPSDGTVFTVTFDVDE